MEGARICGLLPFENGIKKLFTSFSMVGKELSQS